MSDLTFSKYDHDPEAIAWARAKVQAAVDKARDFERQCKAKGDDDAAKRWGLGAYFFDSRLLGPGEGCVVTAFDTRLPDFAAVLEDTTTPRPTEPRAESAETEETQDA